MNDNKTDSKLDDLDNLMDLFDLETSETTQQSNKRNVSAERQKESLKIQSFLENEYQRLKKLQHFFEKKITMIENNKIIDNIISDINLEVEVTKNDLIDQLVKTKSPMNIKINKFWNATFGCKS